MDPPEYQYYPPSPPSVHYSSHRASDRPSTLDRAAFAAKLREQRRAAAVGSPHGDEKSEVARAYWGDEESPVPSRTPSSQPSPRTQSRPLTLGSSNPNSPITFYRGPTPTPAVAPGSSRGSGSGCGRDFRPGTAGRGGKGDVLLVKLNCFPGFVAVFGATSKNRHGEGDGSRKGSFFEIQERRICGMSTRMFWLLVVALLVVLLVVGVGIGVALGKNKGNEAHGHGGVGVDGPPAGVISGDGPQPTPPPLSTTPQTALTQATSLPLTATAPPASGQPTPIPTPLPSTTTSWVTPTLTSTPPGYPTSTAACIAQDNMLYTTRKGTFRRYCGIEWPGQDLTFTWTPNMEACIERCGAYSICTACGWGPIPGDAQAGQGQYKCYLRTNLQDGSRSFNRAYDWQFAIMEVGVQK